MKCELGNVVVCTDCELLLSICDEFQEMLLSLIHYCVIAYLYNSSLRDDALLPF